MAPLRIGVLGAARIAPAAIVRPARAVPGAEVVVVAARQRPRAEAFAAKHGVPRVAASYDEVLADPDVDAVYNPLPNGLHGRWTAAALAAGKHVLCEKPFTADAAEAREVAGAAPPGLVLMEAFHYRYHPLFARARQLLDEGAVGTLRRVETWMCFPLPLFGDIRYDLSLAGGATMDAGCYAIHMARHLVGTEPTVVSARAKLRSPGVDRAMQAELRFSEACTGTVTCSMWSSKLLHVALRVTGDDGVLAVFNPTGPNMYHRLSVRGPGGRTVEHLSRRPTYEFQLEAFRAAVAGGPAPITGPADAIANMEVIDAVYRAAGLEPRRPTS
ncbi:MAG TPA: Gfo/Idh/MocA family oxidoreductase [Acidimicrobiales bacterium]|nr:Gfo/Idh/MocA family oxidoreductase [Acidimicrobiales bacterium]